MFSRSVLTALACLASLALAHTPEQPKHVIAELGKFTFEGGGSIANLRMSYITYGKLNAAKDNAILLLHGFGDNHHGFDGMIGPGKALDSDKYFIISADQLGNTQVGFEHSSSPTSSGMKMNFPAYNHRDMINALHKLVTEALGVRRVLAVVGISLGGIQAVQYAVSYPDFMDGIVPIVGGAIMGNDIRLWNTQIQTVIENCAAWQGGNYDNNSTECAGAAMWTLMHYFFSREWWEGVATREAFDEFRRANWEFYLGIQDMRDVYYLSKTFERSSIAASPGFNNDLNAALLSIKAKALLVYSPEDKFHLPKHVEEQAKLIAGARVAAINTSAGHLLCCGVDAQADAVMGEAIRGFLSELRASASAAR